MRTLHAINYEAPKTLTDAVKLLAAHGEKARPLCGGTDLIIQLRAGVRRPEYVVDVKNIPELRRISLQMQHGFRLGAAVPAIEVHENDDMRGYYPGLTEAAHLIGSLQIQSRASVGGNLCNGSPAADTTPALIALGAQGARGRAQGRARWSRSRTSAPRPDVPCCSRANCWLRFLIDAPAPHSPTPTCASSRATRWISRWSAWASRLTLDRR